jgi:hypothetical protein
MFQAIGSFITAAVIATPIAAICSTVGFTGVAVLAGALFMLAMVPTS